MSARRLPRSFSRASCYAGWGESCLAASSSRSERSSISLPVHFTPYTQGRERIDDQALGRLVDAAYQEAGLSPEQVDTGAIILTGEAIRRDNARAIADLFAAQRGNFVCASAGHNFEALLSAHGSARSPCRRSDKVEFLTSISAAAPPNWLWPSGEKF